MKKINLFLAAMVVMSLSFLQAQTSPDYIFGSQTPWTWTAGTMGTQVTTGVYQWKFTSAATGDVFFKLGETGANTDGSGFWVNSNGADMIYSGAGAMWDTYYQVNSGSGGAVKFPATTGYNYVIQSRKASANTNANFAVFESPTTIATITTVAQAFATGNLTVTITPSSVPDAVQKFWVRYTKDSWTTSQFVEAPVATGVASVAIPLASGEKIEYYVFTTVQAPVGFTDYDFFAVSINTNGGKNYKFMEPLSGDYYIPNSGVQKGFKLLSEAVSYINLAGIAGNTNLLITASMTEPANIGLGVNTNGFYLTVKPQTSVTPTITFTQTATQSIDGNLVIGSPTVASTNLIPTNNVIIDGSNTVGGTTKDMTLLGSVTSNAVSNIRIFGNNDNITIKNCIITNQSTSGNSAAPINVTNFDATNKAPDNLTIQNNTLNSITGNGSTVIHISNSGAPTIGITGLVIRDNIMFGRQRGMFISYTNAADIYGNTISEISQAAQGSAAITLQNNFSTAGTFNIYNNKIIALTTLNTTAGASNGVIGIDNQCVTPKIVNIYNNTISGMGAGAATTTNSKIYGIRTNSSSTCNIYHNTIYIPEKTDMTTFGTSYIAAIVYASTAEAGPTAGGTATIKNNVIISAETGMKTWGIRRVGTTGTFTSDNNNVYRVNTTNGFVGYFNAADAADLLSWKQASSQDINSKSKEVEFVSATDLRLTATSVNDAELGVAKLTGLVDNDILGTPRATTTYMGAHEATDLTIPAPTKTFTVTVPNGTSKVYVAGTFTGKKWNLTAPHELTATANPNEFTGTFACANDVAYKYLCEKGDFDYQAAVSVGGVAEANRTYNAADPAVAAWLTMKTVTLNVSFATSVPSKLYVKGSWDAFATPIELVKTGSTFSTTLSGILANKIPNSTEYKYYTDQEVAVNWESDAVGASISNRWTIAPVMNDVVARFTTAIVSGVNNAVIEAKIMHTSTGIEVIVDGQSVIELYTMNGVMIDKTITNGTYTRNLSNGAYIIRINGKATKFVK